MDAAAEPGRDRVSKHQIEPEYGDEQADAGRDCRTRLAKPNSQARTGTGKNINFPCSADHVQDWQPYPVDPYSCHMYDHTYNFRALSPRNLVLGYERRRIFPSGVGLASPSRDATNWLSSRFSRSVKTRRRFGWNRMVFTRCASSKL